MNLETWLRQLGGIRKRPKSPAHLCCLNRDEDFIHPFLRDPYSPRFCGSSSIPQRPWPGVNAFLGGDQASCRLSKPRRSSDILEAFTGVEMRQYSRISLTRADLSLRRLHVIIEPTEAAHGDRRGTQVRSPVRPIAGKNRALEQLRSGREIARQLKLRNIGGVVDHRDFIDMESRRDQ